MGQLARKASTRPRTIFDESEDEKDRYLSLSFPEILSDIKEYGFPRSSGDYLFRDISAFIRLYRYIEYEYRYGTGTYQSTGERKTLNVAAKSRMDLNKLGEKLAPWFRKHQAYKDAAELFARKRSRLNKAFRALSDLTVSQIQNEKDYAFMAAAGYGLIVRLGYAEKEPLKETYGVPSEKIIKLARRLKHQLSREGFLERRKRQLSREGFSAAPFPLLDSLLSQNNKPTKSLKGDIVRAVARALSEFFLFEGSRQGRPDTSVITSLAEFAGVTISPRMVRREIRKLLSP